jgi:hypothetical protein
MPAPALLPAGRIAGRAGLRRQPYTTIAAKFHAAPLGASQGRFRAGGNHAGLELGHRGHLLQQKLARSAPSIAGKSAKRTSTPASSRRDRKATEPKAALHFVDGIRNRTYRLPP